jgi:hypothetical protein
VWRALAEAAWAAAHSKKSYLGARYRRLAARRGIKRALIAVAHSLLVIFAYHDLGADHFEHLNPERLRRYLVKRLERACFARCGHGWRFGAQAREPPFTSQTLAVRSQLVVASNLPSRENTAAPT